MKFWKSLWVDLTIKTEPQNTIAFPITDLAAAAYYMFNGSGNRLRCSHCGDGQLIAGPETGCPAGLCDNCHREFTVSPMVNVITDSHSVSADKLFSVYGIGREQGERR